MSADSLNRSRVASPQNATTRDQAQRPSILSNRPVANNVVGLHSGTSTAENQARYLQTGHVAYKKKTSLPYHNLTGLQIKGRNTNDKFNNTAKSPLMKDLESVDSEAAGSILHNSALRSRAVRNSGNFGGLGDQLGNVKSNNPKYLNNTVEFIRRSGSYD